jgi:F-type H+-transporting ATPase subunit a
MKYIFFNYLHNPLEQFDIRDLVVTTVPLFFNLHISLTNMGLYLMIGSVFIFILSIITTNFNRIKSNQ